MNEWHVLKLVDPGDDAGTPFEVPVLWSDLGTFETEQTWLRDDDVQRLGEKHGPGSYMLLPPVGKYEPWIELTIQARQTFYKAEPEAASLDTILDPRD